MKIQNQKSSLKDCVYQNIIEMICAGKIKAGEIITENQMIEQFGVSKSPVREALIQLCHENVLQSIPRCGYQIVHISAKNIHDLTELRLYLELSNLQKISEMLTTERLSSLKELLESMVHDGQKDKWTAWKDNVRFHLALTEYAGNIQVTKALERALSTCTRAYAQVYETERSAVVAPGNENLHQKIVRALENHEVYAAHESLRTDILIMEQMLLYTGQAK